MFTTLISAEDLVLEIQKTTTVVVDCRHDLVNPDVGKLAYDAGHIPGAVFAYLDTQLSGPKNDAQGVFKGRHPLPEQRALIDNLRQLGINNTSQVIAYDAQGGMFAARLWWLLRSLGHQAVAVLDGGLPSWMALGQSLQTEVAVVVPGNLVAGSALTRQVNVAQVLANLDSHANDQLQIVDARAADRFRGENESIDPVGGHIPGAVNRFFKDNLQNDGRFKSSQNLKQEWQAIIADPNKAVMQCGSGVTACHNLLALEIAGLSGAALYPGSWSEWCANPMRPVAVGSE